MLKGNRSYCQYCSIGLSTAEKVGGYCNNCGHSIPRGSFETKINQFPVDQELKYEIACLITAYAASMGITITEDQQQQFQDRFSESLVESVLDAILKWEERKLN